MYDLKKLSIDEKITLLTGADSWRTESLNSKLRQVFVSDGPSGLRMMGDPSQEYGNTTKTATAMPTLSMIANTWNTDMAFLDGETIADDCVEKGADILLAPGVNIKRTPLNGRNFEYFSEDPFLAGTMAKSFIQGVQSKGVGTSLKHYLANNREYNRCWQTSEIDERTIREIYLKPFEIAISANPYTVMCSYNPINGVYASENKYFLKDVLRDDLGFKGTVISDWGAVYSPYKAHKATTDLQMPHDDNAFNDIKSAYEKGLILQDEIDFCVSNILKLIDRVESEQPKRKISYSVEKRHQNAVDIAKEGIVLLKNDGILPLNKGNIAVSGEMATENVITGGGGSAKVSSAFKQLPLTDLLNKENTNAKFHYVKDGRGINDDFVAWNLKKASMDFYNSDAVILCVTDYEEKEGKDRYSIKLPVLTEELILDAVKYNPNVIVCVYAGSSVDMSSWIDKVRAVVFVGFGGEGCQEALSSVLVGKTCPSGKLSETFPLSIQDTPTKTFRGNGFYETYSEGIFVGYRYYDLYKKEVLFPFGFGLSYASFEYSNVNVKKLSDTDFEVSFDIENTSDIDAKEVSEIYVKDVFSMVSRPEKELKAFSKNLIKARQKKTVKVNLDFSSFAYYNVSLKRWHVENGTFEILIGSSANDIKLKQKIEISLPDDTQQSQKGLE